MKEAILLMIIVPLLVCTFLAGRFSKNDGPGVVLTGQPAEAFLADFGSGNSFYSGRPGSAPVELGNDNIRFPSDWTPDQGDEYRKTLGLTRRS